MNKSKVQKINRREFAQRAALLSAAIVPGGIVFSKPAAAVTAADA